MTNDQDGEDRRQALALLSQHGFSPSQDELEVLVAAYPRLRMLAASSYAVPGVRYAEPAGAFAPSARGPRRPEQRLPKRGKEVGGDA